MTWEDLRTSTKETCCNKCLDISCVLYLDPDEKMGVVNDLSYSSRRVEKKIVSFASST